MIKKITLLTKLIPVLIAVILVFSFLKTSEKVGELKHENRQLKAQLSNCRDMLGDCEKKLRRQNRRDERRER